MRRLTCRTLQVRFPQPRTAQERAYRLNWIADKMPAEALESLESLADSRDEDRDGNAELGRMQ